MDVDNFNERKVIVKNGFNITLISKSAKNAYIVT